MKKALAASIVVSIFIAQPVLAKPDVNPEISSADALQLDKISDTLFANLQAGKTDAGIRQFFGNSSLMTSKSAQLAMLVSQIDSAIAIYGKISSCEKIESITKGSLVEYRTYTCQHANMLTSWTIAFFKTSNGWIAGNLFFKDQPGQP